MFVVFERIRVVTLPRRLVRGYFKIFGQILEQNQAIMGQLTVKLEGRICREFTHALNGLPRNLHPQLRTPQATKTSFKGSKVALGKSDCFLAVGTAKFLKSRRAASPLVLYK